MSAPQIPLALTPPRRPTFDNFVVGQNQAVVDVLRQGLQPGQWYFLAGSAGSGRSHLVHAVLNNELAHAETVRFIACTDADVIEWLNATSGEWLVLDDVDQLAGEAEAELALFNALNRWRAHQSGVVMTGIQRGRFRLPDLRSRVSQAAKLSLKPLHGENDEVFVELIKQLLNDFQLSSGRGLTDYLLRHAPRSPARMVALFEQFSERARAERRVLTIPLVREYL